MWKEVGVVELGVAMVAAAVVAEIEINALEDFSKW